MPAGATVYVSPHLGRPCRTPGSTISLHPLSVPPSCFTQSVCRSVPSLLPTHSFPANIARTLFITVALFRLVQSRSPPCLSFPCFPCSVPFLLPLLASPSHHTRRSFTFGSPPPPPPTDRTAATHPLQGHPPCSREAKQGPPSAQRSAPDRACHYNQPGRYIRAPAFHSQHPRESRPPVCAWD